MAKNTKRGIIYSAASKKTRQKVAKKGGQA